MNVPDLFTKTGDKPFCLRGHNVPVLNLIHCHTHVAT